MTPLTPTPRPVVSSDLGPPVARPAAAYPVQSGHGVAAGKGLTFSACAGDVFWRAGGPSVFMTPDMISQLTSDLTQEGIDGALNGDVEHIRQAVKLLNELQTACRSAREWREAARVMIGGVS